MRHESLPCGVISHLPQRVGGHHSAHLSKTIKGAQGDDRTHRCKQLDLKRLSSPKKQNERTSQLIWCLSCIGVTVLLLAK